MTVQIALCDDEPAELERTEQLLNVCEQKRSNTDFVIQCFESTDRLFQMMEERQYAPDFIFMDIYMPGEQGDSEPVGMDAARKLRDLKYKGKLIFLTTSKEYALEAFDVEASSYLLKPVSEERLYSKLDKLLEEAEQKNKKYLLLKKERNVLKIALDDVVYCEAQRKCKCIHMSDGTKLFQNMTMEKLYEMCAVCQEFVRLGASYIINVSHIDSLNAQELTLDNGHKIYLSRGTYHSLKEQYFDYYCHKE